MLDKEWETYQQERARLLEEHEGEFVLIHGDKVLGIFGSRAEARRAAYPRLGRVPFLIHEIVAVEKPRRLVCHIVRD